MEKDKKVNYCDDCSKMIVGKQKIDGEDRIVKTVRKCLAYPFASHYAKRDDKARFMSCESVRNKVGPRCAEFIDNREETKELEPSICVQCGSFHNVGRKANGEYFVMGRQGCFCGTVIGKGFKIREEAIADWDRRNIKEEEEPICVICGDRHPAYAISWCYKKAGVVKEWNGKHSVTAEDNRSAWIEERDGKKIAVFKAECELPDDVRNTTVFMSNTGSVHVIQVPSENVRHSRDIQFLSINNARKLEIKLK